MSPAELIDVYRQAVAACHPSRVMPRFEVDVQFHVVALGKAAGPMAEAVAAHTIDGIVVSKEAVQLPGLHCLQGGHPLPDSRSFEAGEALLKYLAGIPQDDLVLVLLSGGASSLVEVPKAGVSEQQILDLNRELLASGLPIEEMNRQRQRLSALKGGGLLRYLPPKNHTLMLADAPPAWVGSGPTWGGNFQVVADRKTLLQASSRVHGAQSLSDNLSMEARQAGEYLASIDEPGLYAAVGECPVSVRGSGRGGRCQEVALAFALAASGKTPRVLLAAASDGEDAHEVAGAWADHSSAAQLPQAQEWLDNNDSFRFFKKLGQHIPKWDTGTNVNDLFLLWVQ